jgi:translocation and assembly module TamB
LRVLLIALIPVAALAIAVLVAAWWCVRTQSGSAWLLARVPGVQFESPQGLLLGDFGARRVIVRLPGEGGTIELDDVTWRNLRIERAPSPLWLRVAMDSLEAGKVVVTLAQSTSGAQGKSAPAAAPATLALPLEVEIRSLRIGAVHAGAAGEEPLRELTARVHLGADAGRVHRVDDLLFTRGAIRASGSARIATAAPMPLAASLTLTRAPGAARMDWSMQAELAGPLAAPAAQVTLRAAATPGAMAQSLDARATLYPFAPWPIGAVHASATAFDLSIFSSAAPMTALTGTLEASSSAAQRPVRIVANISNALAGRWDKRRLPLRSLNMELAARPDQPGLLELRSFSAELGTARASAGRMQAKGAWSAEAWTLSLAIDALQPALLDARAPAVRLTGPVALAGRAAALDTVDIRADLRGALARRGAANPAQLKLDATLNPTRLELRDLRVSAGGARASLSGRLSFAAGARPWIVAAQGALNDFDPVVWWPGPAGSAWRQSRNRLNAHAHAALELPAAAIHLPALRMLAALRGDATVTLDRSWVAGVPLAGEAMLRSGKAAPLQVTLAMDADGNRLQAEGRFGINGSGAEDVWDLAVDGPALSRLAPITRLFGTTIADTTVGGSMIATAQVRGRWPVLATHGGIDIQALRLGAFHVHQAQAQWNIGTAADAPAEAQLTLAQAGVTRSNGPGPSIESLRLQLQGTGRSHELAVRAESNARPPEWIESLQTGALPSATGVGTVAVLQAHGGIVGPPAAKGAAGVAGWRGVIQELELRGAGPAPLLHSRDVALEAIWNAGPLRVSLQPGRIELPVGVLRWSRADWTGPATAGATPRIVVDAELESLRVASLLALAQPDAGWSGDLAVSARVKLRNSGPDSSFRADVVVERDSGDLALTDELGRRAVGVTGMRMSLAVDQGKWTLAESMTARSLGESNGTVVVHASPEAIWPDADAPLEGRVDLQASELATWGNWLPAGWRLDGALRANASLSGRFGAPEITGRIDGERLAVHNFKQGLNVSEGDVAIALRGSTAHIERFSAKAGGGTFTLTGDATLGSTPRAELSLAAEHFQLLGRVDRRIVISGTGRLVAGPDSLSFAGRFGIDEGLIDFSRSEVGKLPEDVEVTRGRDNGSQSTAAAAAPPGETTKAGGKVDLDLQLALGEKLRLRGRGLDTGLRGNLHVTSPGGKLAVSGSVSTVDGTFAAYGQKLTIDRGVVTFNGPIENPRLDIEATRPNVDVRVGVAITGSIAQMRVRLFSEPELPEIDKLSWLLQGRASAGLGSPDLALLQAAALALVAGEGSGSGNRAMKPLGLDKISVRKSEGDAQDTVVGLGKQLSRNWYVGYERGLNATTGSFQLIYRVARRFTLRAQSGEDSSLDVIWVWRWQ